MSHKHPVFEGPVAATRHSQSARAHTIFFLGWKTGHEMSGYQQHKKVMSGLKKKTVMSGNKDTVTTLQNRLWCRPPAALRGFRIQVCVLLCYIKPILGNRYVVTVQKLFTTISSETFTEHVHNFSHIVPSTVCNKVTPLSFWRNF